jgi:nucleoside-diphosphate-sugar epimerase
VHALVTGGGGFLGRAIIRQLAARGDRVRSLARGRYPFLNKLGVESVSGDIRDPDAVERACRDVDVVFHVAAVAGIWGAWRTYHEINTLGTQNVVFACRHAGVPRLVYASSPSVTFDGRDQ